MLFAANASDEEGTTRSASGSERAGTRLSEPAVMAFVIAWCHEKPERIGELAIIPPTGELVLGRGAADSEPRVRFFRPYPGRLEPAAPLASPGISRRQLELRPSSDVVGVRRVGRCTMRINGVECEEGEVGPGDTIGFRQELLLLCARRAACPPPLRHFSIGHELTFGGPDSAGILGESPATWLLRDEIAFAAKTGRHVLLLGESGTGKELAARAIHRSSSRADRQLVARNAATLPASLVDAEMFGNARNYPNPGMSDRPGLVGQADGGFLFLDEIGELAPELQSHLLRVLDSGGEYQRLGESTSRRSDFRLLAATNRDPADLRRDLVARFTVRIELPPLSERREDIPLLINHLVLRAATSNPDLALRFVGTTSGGAIHAKIDTRLVDALLRRDYPSNVRDLEAAMWQAMAKSDRDFVAYHEAAFPTEGKRQSEHAAPADATRLRNPEPSEEEIRLALARSAGNVARATKELGLSSRYALYRRMVKLGIEPGD